MAIVNKIPSMVKSHVDLASYLVEDAFGSVRDISKNVVSHYTVAASMQVGFHMDGSPLEPTIGLVTPTLERFQERYVCTSQRGFYTPRSWNV